MLKDVDPAALQVMFASISTSNDESGMELVCFCSDVSGDLKWKIAWSLVSFRKRRCLG